MSTGIYLILIPFAIIGAVMAYLITYNEWVRHYPTKKEPRKMALEAAIFAFVVFAGIMFIAMFVLTHWIGK